MVCGQGIKIIGIAQLGLKIFCGRFPMNKRISQLLLLAAYSIGVGKRMKSSELPSELPVRPSAEQAVKCPSNHCRGQVTQPNVTNSPVFQTYPLANLPKVSQTYPKKFTRNLRRRPERRQAAAQCAFPKFPKVSQNLRRDFGSFKNWRQWQSPAN